MEKCERKSSFNQNCFNVEIANYTAVKKFQFQKRK